MATARELSDGTHDPARDGGTGVAANARGLVGRALAASPTATGYLTALLAVLVAGLLVWGFDERWEGYTTTPFVLAVVLSAVVGGVGAGLLATAVAALVLVIGFADRAGLATMVAASDVLRLAFFFATGLALSIIGDRLRSTTVRLRGQTAALAAAQERLAESEAEFRAMADSIPQLAWIAEPNGEIVWFNRRWYEFTGATPEQMRGWGWRAVPHPAYVDGVAERMQRAFASGEPWEDTFPMRGADGSYRWFLSRALPIRSESGRIVRWFGTNTDVTEQRQAETDREFLLELSAALVATEVWRDVETIAHAALERLATQLGADVACWLEIDLEARTFTRRAVHAPASIAPPLGTFPLEHWTGSALLPGFERGEVLTVPDAAIDARFGDVTVERDMTDVLRAFVVAPLLRGGRWVAALSVYHRPAHAWTPVEVSLVRSVAERLWPAVEAARAFQAERALRARTERLQRLTASLSTARTTMDVAAATLQAGALGVGSSRGVVLLLGEGARSFELTAAVGYTAKELEPLRRVQNAGTLPMVEAVARRAPIIIGQRAEFAARYPEMQPWMLETGFHGTALFPLVAGDGTTPPIGAIAFDFDHDHEFTPDEIHFLATIADLGAQAMDRALAYAAERRARIEAETVRAAAEDARNAADAANRAKSDFLAVMSHELRTPLNAIAGHVQLVEMGLHGPVTDAQAEALGRVARAQRHLLGLINDVLNYARLESGRVEYTLREVSLVETVREALPMVEPLFAAKDLALVVEMPRDDEEQHDAQVWADREKLAQILLNLLSNAAKFTEPGGRVTVELVGVADGSAPSEAAVLRVSDTGVGIPPDKRESVFQPFVQLNRGLTSTHEGTGLGLAISRDLARGMGGNLTVDSTPGIGSTFTLVLRRTTRADGVPIDRRSRMQRRDGADRRTPLRGTNTN